ncbi:hypothetical protein [Nitrosopumilus spindle-shaped virus]|uniref:Uncharacterized protein n=1 Tax=Nitrosopumilus spindle-shaped virus TaxID=2508184 RepID=A0A514K5A6_9VIRU|nr:hypothetical protein [Nitrosopumilus spindle-shaped virus]
MRKFRNRKNILDFVVVEETQDLQFDLVIRELQN